ncbi:conserved hypothetical protein [Flavobacterium sp. 9AF]|uniref:glycosyltransferase family 2 protein n=1 Tax=Flavobacterium sp. 9AF TaxID=2653142 RepID=UPI0012F2F193|nr:glycosyltransferase family A protein [Flavobacterium sp. 9AF]VXC31442.1 conserved hypothetical protein [Flavobacterium sp. 9AF]
MSKKLSIITPHKDDIDGLFSIFKMLSNQTSNYWEWIIIDDFSSEKNRLILRDFESNLLDDNVKVIFNKENFGPSKSRNTGVFYATCQNIIFLDSDDEITPKFVQHRLITVNDFTVFLNFKIKDKNGQIGSFSNINTDFLTNFLKAKFSWQTTAVLWNKDFLQSINLFNEELILLEDIELVIKALFISKNFKVLYDNEVDYYYYLKPIDIKKRNIQKVATSVDILVNSLCNNKNLNLSKSELKFLSSYYYLSVKYIFRSKEYGKIKFVYGNLNTIFKNKCINYKEYILGNIILKLFSLRLIKDTIFLRINRYLYKK